MANTTRDRHEGQQVKLWVSHELYAALKDRAVRHDTSVAEELRKSAAAGLDPLEGMDELKSGLTKLRQFARMHLEPLAFIAAMDSAKAAEYWKNQTLSAIQKSGMDDPQKVAEASDRTIGERATARIKRKLRELDDEGSDDDGQKA